MNYVIKNLSKCFYQFTDSINFSSILSFSLDFPIQKFVHLVNLIYHNNLVWWIPETQGGFIRKILFKTFSNYDSQL